MLLNQPCAFVDIETTGTHANSEGITEIGVRLIDTTGEVVTWNQLINPGRSIPEFIQNLTGISNAMVKDAPYFEDIASELHELLDGVVFVAHNARFDYSFIKKGFEQFGFVFRPQVVCTVKLSRALYASARRHNLDTICERIGYVRDQSHRALADVDAMLAFIHFAIQDRGIDFVNAAAQSQLARPSQPAHLPMDLIDKIPNTAGVYRFYDEDNRLLYVGKSVHLRDRIKSHFSADLKNAKEMKLSQEVRDIDCTETVGELGALLLENKQIKELSPIYNRAQRRYKKLWTFELNANEQGELIPTLSEKPCYVSRGSTEAQSPTQNKPYAFSATHYGMYTTKAAANKWYKALIDEHGFCKKILGLEKVSRSCFNYQIKRCKGACAGDETIGSHNARLIAAFATKSISAWPFEEPAVITEEAGDYLDDGNPKRIHHLIDQWAYLGSTGDLRELDNLAYLSENIAFDRETYRFLNRYIHLAKPLSALVKIDAINADEHSFYADSLIDAPS